MTATLTHDAPAPAGGAALEVQNLTKTFQVQRSASGNDRLTALDASFLYMDQPTTPMHVGSVAVFRKPRSGFDYERLVELIDDRIAFVPRYRQHVRRVPGRLANPVWVDDEDFDLAYHVRRSALPRPGTLDQLRELAGRIMSRRLDPDRPLWEVYFVEGLEGGGGQLLPRGGRELADTGANQVVLEGH